MTTTTVEPECRVVLGGDIRAVENGDQREVEARICSYGVGPDTYQTTWKPGWALDGLRESLAAGVPVPMVFGHDEKNLANVVGSVAGYEDRPEGLYVRMRMANFDEVPAARTAYSLIRDGHIRGWSYKFRDGQTQPDPQHRGALQFTKAKMVHVSPVVDPSIPGTATVGVRTADEEEGAGTTFAGEIRVPIVPDLSGFQAALVDGIRASVIEGLRDVVITVGADGQINTSDATASTDGDGDGDGDTSSDDDLIGELDAMIDAALAYLEGVDLNAAPGAVGQAYQLLKGADDILDSLMDARGIPDYDDDADRGEDTPAGQRGDGERAVSDTEWNFDAAKYTAEQLRRACLIVLDDGKTKDDCKLPVRSPDGTLNRNAVHAAAAALAGGRGGVDAPMAAKVAAARKLVSLYGQLKEDAPQSLTQLAQRSADDGEVRSADDVDVALARLNLGRR